MSYTIKVNGAEFTAPTMDEALQMAEKWRDSGGVYWTQPIYPHIPSVTPGPYPWSQQVMC